MKGFQKKYLRGLAHGLNPVVMVGQKGLTPRVIRSVDEALNTHELIKIKFVDFKEKAHKTTIAERIEAATRSHLVSIIGHTAVFYRSHPDPENRKIVLPERHP